MKNAFPAIVFFSLAFLSLFAHCAAAHQPETSPTERYIVIFPSPFRPVSDLAAEVSQILRRVNASWEHLPRSRIYESDFVVGIFSESAVQILGTDERIVSVIQDKSFARFASSEEDKVEESLFSSKENESDANFNDFDDEDIDEMTSEQGNSESFVGRKLLKKPREEVLVHKEMNVEQLWSRGITGKGVRIGIFDSGIEENHPHFRNIMERTDWTDDHSADDVLGHGTFVAGLIAGTAPECPGLAPDSELYFFRVFNSRQVSYTSWFLDAFNHALKKKLHILNFSIGGPDFLDFPFLEKVRELVSSGVILVSAIGNDGPLFGTLNNPADMMEVIGVGGAVDSSSVASFSSRGISLWELHSGGVGRMKPDVLALSSNLKSSARIRSVASANANGCRLLSGTSVASPVVAGAVSLLVSAFLESKAVLNPAKLKQVLIHTAQRLSNSNSVYGVTEQGAGLIDVVAAKDFLEDKPSGEVTLYPSEIDLIEDCPYFWPYCAQSLYLGGLPIVFNVTLLNSIHVAARLENEPVWVCDFDQVKVDIQYSEIFWPWSGFLSISISVIETPNSLKATIPKSGHIVNGKVILNISGKIISLPIRFKVIETPPRHQRILWDQFHSLHYPHGFFPKDDLESKKGSLDWNGDHPYTNFKDLFQYLLSSSNPEIVEGQLFYIEILNKDFSCINASNYGTLVIVDPEEEFSNVDAAKLYYDVTESGLSVLILADWYNIKTMKSLDFRDTNTGIMWTPVTGGANLPAVNDLLQNFGIEFGETVFTGTVSLQSETKTKMFSYRSGNSLSRFPRNGLILKSDLDTVGSWRSKKSAAILGMLQVEYQPPITVVDEVVSGRIAVFGDSSCADSSSSKNSDNCFWLIKTLLEFTSFSETDSILFPLLEELTADFSDSSLGVPIRRDDIYLDKYFRIKEDSLPICPIEDDSLLPNALPKLHAPIPGVKSPLELIPKENDWRFDESLNVYLFLIVVSIGILFVIGGFLRSLQKSRAREKIPSARAVKIV